MSERPTIIAKNKHATAASISHWSSVERKVPISLERKGAFFSYAFPSTKVPSRD